MDLITVSDPQTDAKQTVYRVTNPFTRVGVYHRHSEFNWLYERLHKERRGAVIPITGLRFGLAAKAGAPVSSGLGGIANEDDTVDGRCRRLDAFMKEVSTNPELKGAPSLDAFLAVGTGEEFDTAKARIEAEGDGGSDDEGRLDEDGGELRMANEFSNASLGGVPHSPKSPMKPAKLAGFRSYVSKTVAKTTTAVAAMGGKTKLYETVDEERIRIASQYVKDIEAHVRKMSEKASSLVRMGGQDSSLAWGEFGKAAIVWTEILRGRNMMNSASGPSLMSQSRNDVHGSVAVCLADENRGKSNASAAEGACARLGAIGAQSNRAALILEEAALREREFAESMGHLIALVTAMKVALHKRSNSQLMCTNRMQSAAKVSAQASSNADEIRRANRAAEAAKLELEESTGRFLREMNRVDAEMDRRLALAAEGYARVQIEKAEGMREIWSEMAQTGASAGAGTRNGIPANAIPTATATVIPSAPALWKAEKNAP